MYGGNSAEMVAHFLDLRQFATNLGKDTEGSVEY